MSATNIRKSMDKDLAILLVDDDAMVKSIVAEYLQAMGFTNVVSAKNSTQALQLVKDTKNHIDLIISDWEMPEVTGLTLLKTVRNSPQRIETPFILITSQRSMERFKITQAAQWRVSAYIMKPFRMEQLRQKIFEVMGYAEDAA